MFFGRSLGDLDWYDYWGNLISDTECRGSSWNLLARQPWQAEKKEEKKAEPRAEAKKEEKKKEEKKKDERKVPGGLIWYFFACCRQQL